MIPHNLFGEGERMSKGKVSLIGIGLLFLGALCVGQALSQDTGAAPGGGGRGGRGGRGGGAGGMGTFDANAMRLAAATRMKEALGCTDEEYAVLQPKIEKVQTLSREARGGGMMMGGGRGGRGGPGGPGGPGGGAAAPEPTTAVGKAAAALAKVLTNKDAPAEEIKTALQALRDAKAKVKTELEAAVKALKEVLTVRQEAQLVQMGIIE
jgi:hypothetical protein